MNYDISSCLWHVQTPPNTFDNIYISFSTVTAAALVILTVAGSRHLEQQKRSTLPPLCPMWDWPGCDHSLPAAVTPHY